MTTLGCAAKIAARGKVDKDEAKDILAQVKALRLQGVDVATAAARVAATKDAAAASRRLRSVLNARASMEGVEQVEANGGAPVAFVTLKSRLSDTQFPLKHGAPSADTLHGRYREQWSSAYIGELQKLGLEKLVGSGVIDEDIARGIEGSGKTQDGKAAGKAIKELLDVIKQERNKLGAGIDDPLDYIGDTHFDYDQIRGPGGRAHGSLSADEAFEHWWKDEEPWLDKQKTFDLVVPKAGETLDDAWKRSAKEAFTQRLRGDHLIFNDTPRMMFHWKDADSWLKHMQTYGGGGTIHQVVGNFIERSSRETALAKNFGPNPQSSLAASVKAIRDKYGVTNADDIRKFNKNVDHLQTMIGRMDGSFDTPANDLGAKIGQSLRAWEVSAHLGNVGITHLASVLTTAPSEAVHHGISRATAMANLTGALLGSMKGPEQAELVASLDGLYHGSSADLMRQQAKGLPGAFARFANFTIKFSGVRYLFDNVKLGLKAMYARNLGHNMANDFADLDPALQRILQKYGISNKEWGVLQSAPTHYGYITGQQALMTDAVRIESVLRAEGVIDQTTRQSDAQRLIEQYRQNLSDKVMSYIHDAASRSVVQSNLQTRTILLGKTRPGTWEGEIRRFVGQFKAWPIAQIQQNLIRDFAMSMTKGKAAWNIGMLLGTSTILGLGRMAALNSISGRALPDPRHPDILLKALAMGGGGGLFADELFNQVNTSAGGYLSSLGGPVTGDAAELMKIYNDFKTDLTTFQPSKKGRFAALWPSLAQFASKKVPGGNLFFAKGALDYLLWFHLHEASDPGWWDRTNQKLIKDSGHGLPGYMRGRPIPFVPYGLGQGAQ